MSQLVSSHPMKQFDDQYVVVTGGAGFIGSGVLRVLNNQGVKNIVVVDDLGHDEKWKNLVGKRFAEILHKDQLMGWLKGKEREVGAFIHLGACSSTVETDANFLLENNYRYSVRLAEYALEHGHRFIYASSAATYGDGSLGFSDEKIEPLMPLNMYGYSKQLFDLWLLEQGVLDKVVGLKYFNVFGPNEYHKGRMASAVLKMVPQALESGKIKLFKSADPQFGDGEQVRDFIYVKDAARMTVECLTNQLFGIYNVGTGKGETWKALAQGVISALKKPIEIEYIAMPEDLIGKYQNFTQAEMTSGLKAEYTLEAATQDYVQNYLLPGRFW